MTVDAGTEAGFPDPCVGCTPGALPPEFAPETSRSGAGHVGVRFGDVGRFSVYLEGERVDEVTVEAIEGDPGVVLVMDGEVHGDHMETVVRRGLVSVRPRP